MKNERKIWFPAKKYGWGWSWPCAWQGWVAMALWFVAVALVIRFFPPSVSPVRFIELMLLLAIVQFAICLWKGEKPEWRWGDE